MTPKYLRELTKRDAVTLLQEKDAEIARLQAILQSLRGNIGYQVFGEEASPCYWQWVTKETYDHIEAADRKRIVIGHNYDCEY